MDQALVLPYICPGAAERFHDRGFVGGIYEFSESRHDTISIKELRGLRKKRNYP